MGNRLDTLRPHSLVKLGVDSHIRSAHRLGGEVDDRLDGPRSTLFEGSAVHALVHVDGVLPGDDILEGRALLAAGLYAETRL